MKREKREHRRHETYEKDHWETAHIERVDRVFATVSPEEKVPRVRIDMDGFGHAGASLHGTGINIQTSHFIPVEKARELRDQLASELNGVRMPMTDPPADTSNKDLDHVLLPNGVALRRGTKFLVREPLQYGPESTSGPDTFPAGSTFSVSGLEYADGDIQVAIQDGPLDWMEYEALLGHLDRDEVVIAETR
jgi:hypothetical protein